MKIRTNVKAGGMNLNPCESRKVRTGVRAGGITVNRCESLRKRPAGQRSASPISLSFR